MNTTCDPIDVSGLELWDAGVNNWFTFPPGSILGPGGHAIVVTGVQSGGSLPVVGPNDLVFDAGRSSAALNNSPENVVVYDPSSDNYIQATYNGDGLDDPANASGTNYAGFSTTATRIGSGDDFGNDIDGYSIQRAPGDSFINDQTPTPGAANFCFCNGAKILTDRGDVCVETLDVNDWVKTFDNDYQQIRFIYRRRVTAVGADRPVLFSTNAIGNDRPWRASQQHRIHTSSVPHLANPVTGDFLVNAYALINGGTIRLDYSCETVEYFHIMFDCHELIWSDGVLSESWQPKRKSSRSDEHMKRELERIYPEFFLNSIDRLPIRRSIVPVKTDQGVKFSICGRARN